MSPAKLFSTNGHEKVLELMKVLALKSRTHQIDQIFQYCFSKISPLMRSNASELCHLRLGKIALEVIQGLQLLP